MSVSLRLLRAVWVPLVLIAGLCVLIALASLGSEALQLKATTMAVFLVFVVGLYTFVGMSGVVSFGHVAFIAIGAYTTALASIPQLTKHVLLPDLPGALAGLQLDPLPAMLLGGAVAASFALLIAPVITRLNGIAASIAMLSVLVIVNVVLSEAETITRGTGTMTGIPLDTGAGWPLIAACAAILLAQVFQESSLGLKLRASREDEVGARAAGVSIPRTRGVGLVLSAFVMGVGGGLYAQLLGSLSPGTFYLTLTFTTIVMLVIGGLKSLTGAVVGTVLVFALSQGLRTLEQGVDIGPLRVPSRPGLELVGISLVALVVLLRRPDGVTGGAEVPLPPFLQQRRDEEMHA